MREVEKLREKSSLNTRILYSCGGYFLDVRYSHIHYNSGLIVNLTMSLAREVTGR